MPLRDLTTAKVYFRPSTPLAPGQTIGGGAQGIQNLGERAHTTRLSNWGQVCMDRV